MVRIGERIAILLIPIALFMVYGQHVSFKQTSQEVKRKALSKATQSSSSQHQAPRPYSQRDISETARHFVHPYPLSVLAFDGTTNKFEAFTLRSHDDQQDGAQRLMPFAKSFVEALRNNFPQRFAPGQPPVQILHMMNDFPNSKCVSGESDCDAASFAPIVGFTTVPRKTSLLPTMFQFPLNWGSTCALDWAKKGKSCTHIYGVDTRPLYDERAPPWSELIPQVIWRGDDAYDQHKKMGFFPAKPPRAMQVVSTQTAVQYLINEVWDQLSPRWRGVSLTLKAEADVEDEQGQQQQQLPWFNAKFINPRMNPAHQVYEDAGVHVMGQYMTPTAMSHYKYQIDFGGGGGTTWAGTITKLLMPGVLFHHETYAKDWFYDDLQPWLHYIPIQWDLSDLYEKYKWAEAHPERAEQISKAGIMFAQELLSDASMKKLYETYFVDQLGSIVDAYQPASPAENMMSIMEGYAADGFRVAHVASCDETACDPGGAIEKYRVATA